MLILRNFCFNSLKQDLQVKFFDLRDRTISVAQSQALTLDPGLVMGLGEKFLSWIGSGHFFVAWVGSGQPPLGLYNLSSYKSKFFYDFPLGLKKISVCRVKKYSGQSQVSLYYLLQVKSMLGSGQIRAHLYLR